MKKQSALLIVSTLCVTAFAIRAQEKASSSRRADTAVTRIKEALAAHRKERGFPGATAAYVLPSGKAVALAVGFADTKAKVEMAVTHRLFSGSIGKTYFAALALQLVALGTLDLDTRIETYLGDETWFKRLPGARKITITQLMRHTSGLPEHVQMRSFWDAVQRTPMKTWRPVELLEYVFDKKPLFEAGQGWSYADTNYVVLGIIIEKLTKKTVYELVKKRILAPLALDDTEPTDHRNVKNLATGYTQGGILGMKRGPSVVDGQYVINPQFEWCGGGYACTTKDLARWCRQLFAGKVIPEKLKARHIQGVAARTGRGDRYALGVQILQTAYGLSYGHAGYMPGFLSIMAYYPELDLALALQFNTDNGRQLGMRPRRYLDEIAGILLAEGKVRRRKKAASRKERKSRKEN